MYIADTLSGAYLKENDTTSFEKDSEVINMVKYLLMTKSRVKDINLYTTVLHG